MGALETCDGIDIEFVSKAPNAFRISNTRIGLDPGECRFTTLFGGFKNGRPFIRVYGFCARGSFVGITVLD